MGMIIEAGACLRDAKRKESGPSDKMEGYMYIAGARKQKGRHAHATIYVAKDVVGGQFALYFCSTKCLKIWFKQIVEEFERKLKAYDETVELKGIKKYLKKVE